MYVYMRKSPAFTTAPRPPCYPTATWFQKVTLYVRAKRQFPEFRRKVLKESSSPFDQNLFTELLQQEQKAWRYVAICDDIWRYVAICGDMALWSTYTYYILVGEYSTVLTSDFVPIVSKKNSTFSQFFSLLYFCCNVVELSLARNIDKRKKIMEKTC